MARWRKRPGKLVIPAWVCDDILAPEADEWLEGLDEQNPVHHRRGERGNRL